MKLSEVNTRAVFREQNKLIGKFKMAAGDVISIRGRLWSTRTFQHFAWIATGRSKLSGLLEEDRWPFNLVNRLFLVSLT